MESPSLIVGGDSAIGRNLKVFWEKLGIKFHASTRHLDVVSHERPYIDLTDGVWDAIHDIRYDSVVFCAAITGLANCENNPSFSHRVNVENTLNLARLLSRNAEYLLFLSSDQVLGGSIGGHGENKLSDSKSEYGRQKAEAEVGFMSLSNAGVLRLGKVVHEDWPLFRNWKKRLRAGERIEAYVNLNLAPVRIEDVVLKIDELLKAKEPSIARFAASEEISYFMFAKEMARELGVDPCLVRGVVGGTSLA